MDILIIDDEKSIRESTKIAIETEGHYVEAVDGAEIGLMRAKEDPFDVVFIDLRLGEDSGLDVLKKMRRISPKTVPIVFTAYASVETAVQAIQMGAMDYLEKPFTPTDLRSFLARAQKQRRLNDESPKIETAAPKAKVAKNKGESPPSIFESEDESMQAVFRTLFKAANTRASILILGESGTGKSMLAKEIHSRSKLASGPFVTVHCPSLSKELLESELFGHTKGAFTGAVKDQWGKVHAADGGTLFLDEIGELPLDIQPKLLRLLQEKEYERVGETQTRTSDVRIVSATNRDLQDEVKMGNFREDLFYRLNVISAIMPPLRDRPNDLEKIAQKFLKYFTERDQTDIEGFSRSGHARLIGYSWPGNLRELRNSLEKAVILAEGNLIESEDLPSPTIDSVGLTVGGSSDAFGVGGDVTLEEIETEHLKRILERTNSLQEAANVLGIDQATLYRKRKKLGLK